METLPWSPQVSHCCFFFDLTRINLHPQIINLGLQLELMVGQATKAENWLASGRMWFLNSERDEVVYVCSPWCVSRARKQEKSVLWKSAAKFDWQEMTRLRLLREVARLVLRTNDARMMPAYHWLNSKSSAVTTQLGTRLFIRPPACLVWQRVDMAWQANERVNPPHAVNRLRTNSAIFSGYSSFDAQADGAGCVCVTRTNLSF